MSDSYRSFLESKCRFRHAKGFELEPDDSIHPLLKSHQRDVVRWATGKGCGMKFATVCSGIEVATVAWEPLGWEPVFYSEIDAHARKLLRHHYPDTPLHGDFTTIKGDEYGSIDLLAGGTPCQSFSVSGKRAGLDDPRGNLALEFLALARRMRPAWLVWENVPGMLSSWSDDEIVKSTRAGGDLHGIPLYEQDILQRNDFATFLSFLGECGYQCAWRVLDAQHFGVPQRRRRIVLVGYLGDWRPAAAVLFERESLQRDITPRREAGKGITGSLSARTEGGGGLGTDFECQGGLIAHTLRGNGFDASEDGTGRGVARPVPQAVAFAQNSRDEVRICGGDGQIAGALGARPGMKQQNYIASIASLAVRRLTPLECERLQGFPDGYTDVAGLSDSARYALLGNSWAVPKFRWVGKRIAMMDAISKERRVA